MLLAFTVFLSIFLSDIFWVYCVRRATHGDALYAALWAVPLYLSGIIGTLSVVHNPILIIPAIIGCFTGTFVAVHLDKKKPKSESIDVPK